MAGAIEGGGDRPAYLIVLRHVLVAEDLAMTIGDHDPGARVVTAVSPAEAVGALRDVGRLAVAFVGDGPRAHHGSDLSQAIEARGGRTVLIGEEAEADGARLGYPVLARPFSTRDILTHLAGGQG